MKVFALAGVAFGCKHIPNGKLMKSCPVEVETCGLSNGVFTGCNYGAVCIPDMQPAVEDYWSGSCRSCAPQVTTEKQCYDAFFDKGEKVLQECITQCVIPDLCDPKYDDLDHVTYMEQKLSDHCADYSWSLGSEGTYSMDEEGIYFQGLGSRNLGSFIKFKELIQNERLKQQFFSKNCQDGRSTEGASIAGIIPGGDSCLRGKINSRLHFKCDTKNALISVRHISSCQYYFYFSINCNDLDDFMAKQAAESEAVVDWEDYSLDELVQSSSDDSEMEGSSDDSQATLFDMPDVQLKMGQ